MKLLHTADWHLGLSLGGVSLLEEQRLWAEELAGMASREGADAVLIAGDVFDRAVASAEAIALYDQTVTRLIQDCGAQVLVLAGNHDGAARLAQMGTLLAPSGLHLAGSLRERPTPVVIGDAEIVLLPYFHPAQVQLLYPAQEIHTAHEAMCALMDDVRAQHDPSRRLIVGAHCFVTGASPAESDFGAQLGGAAQVGAEAFQGADYVALGHLHRAQSPAPNVRYSGTPYPYAFSEGGNSAALYDTATDQVKMLEFHPVRTLRTLCGAYADILAQAEQDTRREDYLKIELTDRAAGLEALETLRTLYPNLIMLSGKAAHMDGTATLDIKALQTLSPRELLTRFCMETGDLEPTAQQIAQFLAALQTAREGGTMQ